MSEVKGRHESGCSCGSRETLCGAATRLVSPIRISTDSDGPVVDDCEVAVEKALTLTIAEIGSFTLMCTPCDVEALAIGFAHTEGIISSAGEIVSVKCREDPLEVAMQVEDPGKVVTGRNLIVTGSCGLCGQRNIDRMLEDASACERTLEITSIELLDLAEQMRSRQTVFRRTGGTHAACLFDSSGAIVSFAEDVGRHNAMDKVIGLRLADGKSPRGCGAILSGRISLELIAKASAAGIEVVAAVSAPSSLAIDLADRCAITLCGFVRETRATVFTHAERISNACE